MGLTTARKALLYRTAYPEYRVRCSTCQSEKSASRANCPTNSQIHSWIMQHTERIKLTIRSARNLSTLSGLLSSLFPGVC